MKIILLNSSQIQGGTSIKINGDGFNAATTNVQFGDSFNYNKLNSDISFDRIIIQSNALTDGVYLLNVLVNNQNSLCSLDNCSFTASSSYTPSISTVSPNNVTDSNTEVTIDGQNFGTDLTKVSVKIGDDNCYVSNVTDTQLKCNLDGLSVGDQTIVVTTGIYNLINKIIIDYLNVFLFL